MNKEKFSLLVVNVMAIANKMFSVTSSRIMEDLKAELSDEDVAAESSVFSTAIDEVAELGILGDEDTEEMLNQGYNSLVELQTNFNIAFQKANEQRLLTLLGCISELKIDLTNKMTGDQLTYCVDYFSNNKNKEAFDNLNQYCESLFQDPTSDIIMQALADENIAILIDRASDINAASISYENIDDAVLFKTVDIFKWLAVRYVFKDGEIITLLESVADEPEYFQQVLGILDLKKCDLDKVLPAFSHDPLLLDIVMSHMN